jgi:transposase
MDQEGILVSKRMEFEHQVISDFLSRKMSRVQASELLGVRERTISRKARRLEKKGLSSMVHGNKKRSPSNKILESKKHEVMKLVVSRYFDFNMTHCLEVLKAEHNLEVGYDTLRRWSHEKHLVKRKKRRRSKPRNYRDRMECEGLLLQFDGSPHRWNGKDEWCLIGAIDDATSKMPYAEFFLSEDTLSCMTVMQRIIEKNGIPYGVYVDRAGWFGGQKRQNFAQFKRACEELEINIIFANSPQAKGRIERAWDTIQDRLIPEMRIRNIHRMPAANHYLQNQFLPNYWALKNTVVPRSLEVKYRKLDPRISLNEIFCTKEYRVVKGDHTISWHGEIYQMHSPLKYSIQNQEIELRTYQNLTWKAYFAGKEIEVKKILLPEKIKEVA